MITGPSTISRDITERKHAEQERDSLLAQEQVARAEAQDARQRLELLVEASAVLASSLDTSTTLANQIIAAGNPLKHLLNSRRSLSILAYHPVSLRFTAAAIR